MANVVLNWSSGKDAAMAYAEILQNKRFRVSHLLTTLSLEHGRVFMHGVREQLLDMQAERMKLPLTKLKLPASPDDDIYSNAMQEALTAFRQQGIDTAAFGDIFLEDLKLYRESQLAKVGVNALFPLWKRDTRKLVNEIANTDIEAIVICVSEKHLGKEYLGRKIDADFLNDLPAGVDPCGENGEYHSFVYNAPFFSSPIPVITGETVYRSYAAADKNDQWNTGFYFLDLSL